MPSMEAILMTLARFSALAAARSGAASALVRKNGVLRLRFATLSQPLSGNASKSAPQAVPALLCRPCESRGHNHDHEALHQAGAPASRNKKTSGPKDVGGQKTS